MPRHAHIACTQGMHTNEFKHITKKRRRGARMSEKERERKGRREEEFDQDTNHDTCTGRGCCRSSMRRQQRRRRCQASEQNSIRARELIVRREKLERKTDASAHSRDRREREGGGGSERNVNKSQGILWHGTTRWPFTFSLHSPMSL